jgi:5-methyltetrahydrofolate--homocysteine methyltransferase
MQEVGKISNQIYQAVLDCNVLLVEKLSKEALENDLDSLAVVENGLVKGIRAVGEKFQNGEFFLPDLVMAGEAVKSALRLFEPELQRKNQNFFVGSFLIGTVEGDIHDIGKTIVASMLQGNGFRVADLGADVQTEKFLKEVKEKKPDILGLSALLPTTMPKQQEVIERLKAENLRAQVKVMIGGSPVTSAWAAQIGADGYGEDAVQGVKNALEIIKTK